VACVGCMPGSGERRTRCNLSRWQDSGQPHDWVWGRSGVWCHAEFASLLDTLCAGPYWPLNEVGVVTTLEAAAKTYCDLERWSLLGEPPAPPKDDDVWF